MVDEDERPSEILTQDVLRGARGRQIRPKSAGQKRYIDTIAENVITFGIGPAGTGKSWLAVAMAVRALQAKEVQRIILTRPAVEAGERLGFLPGDLMAKIDPYLRPLYDALYDMVELEAAQRLLERQTVEVAPLAFMRGRTLNNSFIILDEAQNTTPEQMKMFLTRIGFGSRVVVTGDVTQIDVPDGRSGLVGLERVLQGIEGLAFVQLTASDVVRHRIVADIVAAYERDSGAAAWPNAMNEPPSPTLTAAADAVVVVGADEQDDVPVDLARWTALAEAVLRDEQSAGRADADVRRRRGDGRAERRAPRSRGPHRRAVVPPRHRGRRRVCPCCSATSSSARRSPLRRPARHAGTLDDELALLVVHGVLHVLGHDHAADDERTRMQSRERELLERHHWHGPAPAGFRQDHGDQEHQ